MKLLEKLKKKKKEKKLFIDESDAEEENLFYSVTLQTPECINSVGGGTIEDSAHVMDA